MISGLIRFAGAAALAGTLLVPPAYAQRGKVQEAPQATGRKPVVEYIAVVVLLAIPIGLVCRSSRR